MLYEMNPELLEKVYLMPKLKLFAAALAKLKNDDFAKAKIITSSLNCTSVGGFSIGYTVSSTGGLAEMGRTNSDPWQDVSRSKFASIRKHE